MIAVIADDLTGAAEIAGIGLRYGLTVQLAMPGARHDGSQLMIVTTDSRSMSGTEASAITVAVTQDLLREKPQWLYKKIDSVLRGHVLIELIAGMRATSFNRAIVVPCNPSLGRSVRDGKYFIDGRHVHETAFASDPEFPISDSSVLGIIGASPGQVQVIAQQAPVPSTGIIIGEAASGNDILAWAGIADAASLLVGGSDFFDALLQREFTPVACRMPALRFPCFYVCGTAYKERAAWLREIGLRANVLAWLPSPGSGDNENERTLNIVSILLEEANRCILAIDPVMAASIPARDIRTSMASIVKQVLEENEVPELFIEGGSTAGAILRELGIGSLQPTEELARGVVRMKAKGWYLTVKPGSYALPDIIKTIFEK